VKRLTFVIVLASACLVVGLAAQQPSFKAGIDIVSLNVTVTDGANHYVTDLDQPDFNVFEDGIKQNVTFFNRRQQPIALSLLLDSSASMEEHLPILQQAATNFVHRLKSNDIAQVIDFDSRVEIRQTFTGNQAELDAAIAQLTAGGSTSLHNAIYIALKELRKVRAVNEEDVRRQALIVFSDGEDTSSVVGFDDVLGIARKSGINIYTICLQNRYSIARAQSGRKYFSESDYSMKTLARETGVAALIATHNLELTRYMDRVFALKDGVVHFTPGKKVFIEPVAIEVEASGAR